MPVPQLVILQIGCLLLTFSEYAEIKPLVSLPHGGYGMIR